MSAMEEYATYVWTDPRVPVSSDHDYYPSWK